MALHLFCRVLPSQLVPEESPTKITESSMNPTLFSPQLSQKLGEEACSEGTEEKMLGADSPGD